MNGKKNKETMDKKISIGIDKLNRDIFISTDSLRRSMDSLVDCKKRSLFCRMFSVIDCWEEKY